MIDSTAINHDGRDAPSAGPYATAALAYRDAGWEGVIPVDLGDYGRVPSGWTGDNHSYPNRHHVETWLQTQATSNVGLRVPDSVLGIDVDCYEGTDGCGWLAWLESQLGELPPTVYSTARDDGSRIMLFSVPPELHFLNHVERTRVDGKSVKTGVELIQRRHRWVRCWPSVNRKINRVYHWHSAGGQQLGRPPFMTELAALPQAWLDYLTGPAVAAVTSASVGEAEPFDWSIFADDVEPGQQAELLHRALSSIRGGSIEALRVVGNMLVQRFENDPASPKGEWTAANVEEVVRSVARYPVGRDDALSPDLQRFVDGFVQRELTAGQRAALTRESDQRWARRTLDERDAAEARGPRPRRDGAAYAALDRPAPVLPGRLAAEVNLLGGPSEAGKSLLARDWALEVANSGRNVLWVASEGMHDFDERWEAHPLWSADVAARLFVLDEPVSITYESEVDWLLNEYADVRPAVVVFDLIYDMGMQDDNGFKDVGPVFTGLKRISAEWTAATLALGHNGHNRERRFRGSASWRQRAYTEWHMAENVLSCEKSKIGRKPEPRAYAISFPNIAWIDVGSGELDQEERLRIIREHIRDVPGLNQSERARQLAPVLGLSVEYTRSLVKKAG